MKKLRGEAGSANALLVPVVLLILLFITTAGLAVWAFMGRQDYKNNSDQKAAVAVAAAQKETQAKDAADFAEASKSPLKQFSGPEAYGGVKVQYPKTWSAYAADSNSGSPMNVYFHADFVPAPVEGVTYNLRIQVAAMSYSESLREYEQYITKGNAKAVPYSLPKVPSVVGTQVSGNIFSSNRTADGTMILLPLRDKTLKIWTESPAFASDFNQYILPNITFSP